MPGLIDAHVHLAMVEFSVAAAAREPAAVYAMRVAREIEATLDAGFTTVRDAAAWTGGTRRPRAEG